MSQAPPYPSDTEPRGWALDLDYEKIEQSDTWALALPEQRPWLLMLWLVAWRQVPSGSLPDDDRLIAARIGMPMAQFSTWRDVLLRGWWRATDGRLYHATLTQHVLRMIDKRRKVAERVTRHRSQGNGAVTRYNGVTNPLVMTPTPTEKHARASFELTGSDESAPGPARSARTRRPRGEAAEPKPQPATAATWIAYAEAFRKRYGVEPVRNAKVNGVLANLIARIGADDAPEVARWYVQQPRGLYVSARHAVDLLLRDCEGLHADWRRGIGVTDTEARMSDRTAATGNVFHELIEEARRDERPS